MWDVDRADLCECCRFACVAFGVTSGGPPGTATLQFLLATTCALERINSTAGRRPWWGTNPPPTSAVVEEWRTSARFFYSSCF